MSRNHLLKNVRIRTIFILLAALLLLTGCWDRREIEERSSVTAMGVDLIRKNEQELIRLTVQLPIPLKIASGGGGAGGGKSGLEAVRIMSSTGRTYSEAVANLQKRMNQRLFFGHTRIIAFGERLARSGLQRIIDPLRRNPQIRRMMWPVVVHNGEARDLLNSNPELEQIPTVYLFTMIENGTDMGVLPQITLGRFYVSLSNHGRQPALIYVDANKKDVKVEGVAALKEDRLVGFLADEEMWSWLRLTREKSGGDITFQTKEESSNFITFRPHSIRRNMEFSEKNRRIHTEITLAFEGDVVESTYDSNFRSPRNIAKLEKRLESLLTKNAQQVINTIQKDFQTDILGLGRKLRASHHHLWKRADWSKTFPDVTINVRYDVKLRRTGMEMK